MPTDMDQGEGLDPVFSLCEEAAGESWLLLLLVPYGRKPLHTNLCCVGAEWCQESLEMTLVVEAKVAVWGRRLTLTLTHNG